MKQNDFSKRILVGITGWRNVDWQKKLEEINDFGISKVALFLERFDKTKRQKIYEALLTSKIKEIPLVHIRHDMEKGELAFLARHFNSSCFTIHEDSFEILTRWRGFYKHLFLEMNIDSFVSRSVEVKRIGGFCVDLAHFKVEEEKWSKEFEYIVERRKVSRYFACNHLNGYSFKRNIDLHTIKGLKDFDYLKTLPEFLFGDIIALETENSITEQLRFKKYLSKLLNSLFRKHY